MVGAHPAVKAGIVKRLYYFVHIKRAFYAYVSALFKALLSRYLYIPQMHERRSAGKCFKHIRHVVFRINAQTARAKGKSVIGAVNYVQQTAQIFLVRDYPGQSEHAPRRVVGVNGEFYVRLLRHGHDLFQKYRQIFPKRLFVHALVPVQKLLHALFGVTAVPAGQGKFACERIHRKHGFVVVSQGV